MVRCLWSFLEIGLLSKSEQEQALCFILDVDDDMFFPDLGATTRPAKALCRLCPVIEECLASTVEDNPSHGVFGGLQDRSKIIQKANRA